MEILQEILNLFLTLAGFAAFIAFLVNVLKIPGWITDGNAALWVKYLNFAGFFIVGVLFFIAPNAIPSVDKILGLLAELGGVLLPVLALLFGWPLANRISKFTHDNVRSFPVLGYSNSKG